MLMIGLSLLREFRRGDDPRRLLVDEDSFLFPIFVGKSVRTGAVMSVDPHTGSWTPSAFGKASLAAATVAMRDRVRAARPGSDDHVLVEIPALVARFLGHDEAGVFYLTSLRDMPEAGVVAGETTEAAGLLERLVPMARGIDDSHLN